MSVPRLRNRLHLEALEPRWCMSFGALDATFGEGGFTRIENQLSVDSYDEVSAITAFADQSVVVAGTSEVGRGTVTSLAKLDIDGQMVASFGEGGRLLLPYELTSPQVATTDDGKFFLGGFRQFNDASQYVVMRLLANGSIDYAFAFGYYSLASDSGAQMAPMPDGGVAVLTRQSATSMLESDVYRVWKLAADGRLDESYGMTGASVPLSLYAPNSVGTIAQFAVDEAGRAYVAGSALASNGNTRHLKMARLTSSGELDVAFGTGGFLQTQVEVPAAWRILPQAGSGGAVLITWLATDESSTTLNVRRLKPNGSLDSGFGTAGLLQSTALPGTPATDASTPLLTSLGPGSTWIATALRDGGAGYCCYSAVINSEGKWESTYGDQGLGTSDPMDLAYLEAIVPAILPNGDIRIAAWGETAGDDSVVDWHLLALETDGSSDTDFGTDGMASVDFTRETSYVRSFDVQSGGARLFALHSPLPSPSPSRQSDFGAAYVETYFRSGLQDTDHRSGGAFSLDQAINGSTFSWIPSRDGGFLTAEVHPVAGGEGAFWAVDIHKRNAAGEIDASFGSGGLLRIVTDPPLAGTAPLIRQANRGAVHVALQTSEADQAWIARLSESGTLDQNFGSAGIYQLGNATIRLADLLTAQDNTVYLLATARNGSNQELHITALTQTGQLKTTFGEQGSYRMTLAENAEALRIAEDQEQRLLVLYRQENTLSVRRLSRTGEPDSTFGTNGDAVLPEWVPSRQTFAELHAFRNQVVVAATTGVFEAVATVFFLNDDGSPDTRFGDAGQTSLNAGSGREEVQHVSVLPDGSVILGVRLLDSLNSYGLLAKLQRMDPNPAPLHNIYEPLNVTAPADRFVSPRDALFVITFLNHSENYEPGTYGPEDVGYIDTNGDGFVSPIDALLVIDRLNRAEGEGESGGAAEGESGNVAATATWSRAAAWYWASLLWDDLLEDESDDASSPN